MRRFLSIFLIIVGVLVIGFPKIRGYYYNYQQQKLLSLWEENRGEETPYDSDEGEEPVHSEGQGEDLQLKKYIEDNLEGVLRIDKIDFYQPVLKGESKKNLNISVASIDQTGKAGEIGNYCIAGHRNRTYGRNFNRLDELTLGDKIEFIDQNQIYQYKIIEKVLVTPEETEVLKGNGKDRMITLVTCDYSAKPSLRLIVKGIMEAP
jgi:sortase A